MKKYEREWERKKTNSDNINLIYIMLSQLWNWVNNCYILPIVRLMFTKEFNCFHTSYIWADFKCCHNFGMNIVRLSHNCLCISDSVKLLLLCNLWYGVLFTAPVVPVVFNIEIFCCVCLCLCNYSWSYSEHYLRQSLKLTNLCNIFIPRLEGRAYGQEYINHTVD